MQQRHPLRSQFDAENTPGNLQVGPLLGAAANPGTNDLNDLFKWGCPRSLCREGPAQDRCMDGAFSCIVRFSFRPILKTQTRQSASRTSDPLTRLKRLHPCLPRAFPQQMPRLPIPPELRFLQLRIERDTSLPSYLLRRNDIPDVFRNQIRRHEIKRISQRTDRGTLAPCTNILPDL